MIAILTFWIGATWARDIYVTPGERALMDAVKDAVSTAGRDTIHLAPGDYAVDDPIYLSDNLIIVGDAGPEFTSIHAITPDSDNEFWTSLPGRVYQSGDWNGDSAPPIPMHELFFVAPGKNITFEGVRIRLLESDCENGLDDDGNGLADCDDPYCYYFATKPKDGSACDGSPLWEPVCTDGAPGLKTTITCGGEGATSDSGASGGDGAESSDQWPSKALGPYSRYHANVDFRAFTVAPTGELTLRNVEMFGWRASFEGSAVYGGSGGYYVYAPGVCEGDGGLVTDGGAGSDSGLVSGGDGELLCDPALLTSDGGILTNADRANPSKVTLDDVRVSHSGILYLAGDFWWNGSYGPIRGVGATLTVLNSMFEFSRNWRGGAISVQGGTVNIDGNTFRKNSSVNGGAVHISGGATVDLKHNLFCGNNAGTIPDDLFGPVDFFAEAHEGGAVWADDYTYLDVANNIFDSNSSLDYGGALYIGEGRQPGGASLKFPARIRNNTFVSNSADGPLGSAAFFYSTPVWFWNNLVAYNSDSALSGSFLPPSNTDTAPINDNHIIEGNLIFQDVPASGDMLLFGPNPQTTVTRDPAFLVWGSTNPPTDTDFGRCETLDAATWYLAPFSPAIDAGRAPVLEEDVEQPNLDQDRNGLLELKAEGVVGRDIVERDVDGSRSDIGAFGGPDADVVDADGDNFASVIDCNDNDPTVHPGSQNRPSAAEVCDGKDNDCDKIVDEGYPAQYPDEDGDGYGNANAAGVSGCTLVDVEGFVPNSADCDDTDPEKHGGFRLAEETPAILCGLRGVERRPSELLDANCDGIIDFTGQTDLRWQEESLAIVEEACDGKDNDCDGITDEMPYNAQFEDGDDDDYGIGLGSARLQCKAEDGYALQGGDCNDANEDVYPGAPVVPADRIDQDCSGGDECYVDLDGDDYGDDQNLQIDNFGQYIPDGQGGFLPVFVDDNDRDCGNNSAQTAAQKGDCDDRNVLVNAGRTEIVGDGIDQDCDGAGLDGCYEDNDGDGVGSGIIIGVARSEICGVTLGALNGSKLNGDCDDADPEVFPTNVEVCDEKDNNCDLVIDEAPTVDGGARFQYRDGDGDGVGSPSVWVVACAQGVSALPGFSLLGTDCDDLSAANRPGAAELCDGVDNDCNGVADEDPIDRVRIFPDLDGDSWGDKNANVSGLTPVLACPNALPSGFAANYEDCDDADAETGICASTSCSQSPGAGSWALVALGLAAVRRRRSSVVARAA
jgi:MYXO-CTERM domain-containing protein